MLVIDPTALRYPPEGLLVQGASRSPFADTCDLAHIGPVLSPPMVEDILECLDIVQLGKEDAGSDVKGLFPNELEESVIAGHAVQESRAGRRAVHVHDGCKANR